MYDPHAPYAPPADYLGRAGGNAYDGEVAYVDAQVGRMLEELKKLGLENPTATKRNAARKNQSATLATGAPADTSLPA